MGDLDADLYDALDTGYWWGHLGGGCGQELRAAAGAGKPYWKLQVLRFTLEGRSAQHPDPEFIERWNEHCYRKLYGGLTHEQYLDEPGVVIDFALAFQGMENEMEKDAIKRAQEKRK